MPLGAGGVGGEGHMRVEGLRQGGGRPRGPPPRHILDEIGGPRAEYVSLDGFDAARLLVADLLVPAGVVDPLLAIPHEHACLIAPTADRHHIARRAQRMFETARVPLTPRLYRPSP